MSVSNIGCSYCMHHLIHLQKTRVPSTKCVHSVNFQNKKAHKQQTEWWVVKTFRTVLLQIRVSQDGTPRRLINSYRLFEERSAFLNCFILKIMARNPFQASVTSLFTRQRTTGRRILESSNCYPSEQQLDGRETETAFSRITVNNFKR